MKHPEAAIQRAIAGYLDWCLPSPYWYTAIGHGGGGELRGMILRGMGLKRGVWDLLLRGPALTGWIEVKSAKGSLTPEQRAFQAMVEAFGDETAVCRSLDDVRAALTLWRVPTRETRPQTERIKRAMAAALREIGD